MNIRLFIPKMILMLTLIMICESSISKPRVVPKAMDFNSQNRKELISYNPLFESLFAFLDTVNLSLLEPGRYEILKDEVFFFINEKGLIPKDSALLEVHNDYLDMHVAFSSAEGFGVKERKECISPRDKMRGDILFYNDSYSTIINLEKGQFIVFSPEYAHAPMIGDGRVIRKAVFKIKVDKSAFYKECDSLAMVKPRIIKNENKKYSTKNLDYGMTIGIERTPKGRIWSCWCGGGDNGDSFFVLAWSDNNGKRWTDVKYVIDPHDSSLPLKRRTIVGQLWTDPLGRLWLFFDQAMTYFDGRGGNWYSICNNPDDKDPVWSEPQYIGIGCTLNKPTVMSTGEWVLPVSLWPRSRIDILLEKEWDQNPLKEAYHELDHLRGAHAYVSTDEGKTWEDRGMVKFPEPSFDEHLFVELPENRWWMTARTGLGIWQSFSTDRGYSWSEPEKYLEHVNSRHFILRLASGKLLMIKHGMPDKKLKSRSHLRAFLSTDNGKTWVGNLLLDERTGISYPTGFQSPDGYIYISYDYERSKCGEIYMAKFNEEDILSGGIVSSKGKLQRLISKPGKIKSKK